jgi:hypothetical protein
MRDQLSFLHIMRENFAPDANLGRPLLTDIYVGIVPIEAMRREMRRDDGGREGARRSISFAPAYLAPSAIRETKTRGAIAVASA